MRTLSPSIPVPFAMAQACDGLSAALPVRGCGGAIVHVTCNEIRSSHHHFTPATPLITKKHQMTNDCQKPLQSPQISTVQES